MLLSLNMCSPLCPQTYRKYESLQFWAAKAIIGTKKNFFEDPHIAPMLKDYIADVYRLFNVCHHCNKAKLTSENGKPPSCKL